jgi:rare lipoprotein A
MRILLLLLWVACRAHASESGVASYIDPLLRGRPTANGELFNPRFHTAASYTHFKQWLLVTNPANGKSVVVWVNDKGPNKRLKRIIDLSPAAYQAIADKRDLQNGTMLVTLQIYVLHSKKPGR